MIFRTCLHGLLTIQAWFEYKTVYFPAYWLRKFSPEMWTLLRTVGVRISTISRRLTLGVVLNNKLTSDHVTHNIQKALGRRQGLHRIRTFLLEPVQP